MDFLDYDLMKHFDVTNYWMEQEHHVVIDNVIISPNDRDWTKGEINVTNVMLLLIRIVRKQLKSKH